MSSTARVVRLLRGLASNPTMIRKSLVSDVETMMSPDRFSSLTSRQVASILTSTSVLGDQCPQELMRSIYRSVVQNLEQGTVQSMNDLELTRSILSFGFLVKLRLGTIDHTRVGGLMLATANERLSSISDPRMIRNTVKGISLLRLPVSAELVKFYDQVPWEQLTSFDEQVFVCRSAIDYGLLTRRLFERLLQTVPAYVSSKTATSFLYSLAISGIDIRDYQGLLLRLLDQAAPSSNLTPLWACHIMGVLNHSPKYQQRLQDSLVSANVRDRSMAEFILGREVQDVPPIKQSAKHARFQRVLESIHGPMIPEYRVAPHVIVDCAAVERRTAVEFQGPSHYLIDVGNGKRILNGPTLHKTALIKRLGWKVIQVDLSNPDLPLSAKLDKFLIS